MSTNSVPYERRLNRQASSRDMLAGLLPEARSDGAFTRLWRAFLTARVGIALVLLALQGVVWLLAGNLPTGSLALSAFYLAAASVTRLRGADAPPNPEHLHRWLATIGVDIAVFTTLQWLQNQPYNYGPLLALPVILAATMGSLTLALGTASAITLQGLALAWKNAAVGDLDLATSFMQAGLIGAGYIALAALTNQLGQRLLREQELTRRSQRLARLQAQVNELVIETLSEGVLVIDNRGTVHSVNPIAQALIAPGSNSERITPPFRLGQWPELRDLDRLALQTFRSQRPQTDDAVLPMGDGSARRLRISSRLTRSDDTLHGSLCVMFVQDHREIEARVRQEKILAMGRMSTAVAHEIRNPLAAISQASGLLAEDLRNPGEVRLNQIVLQNAQRLGRIVDDVLDIARVSGDGDHDRPAINLDEQVQLICADWNSRAANAARLLICAGTPDHTVRFVDEHLRRILVNLLDNAARHASERPGSMRVETTIRSSAAARLTVWSDGPPLDPTVRQHLFEPFFSSQSRSSGLGLYICRELCVRHHATLGYERQSRDMGDGSQHEGNSFFVDFDSPAPVTEPLSSTL